MTGAAGKRPRAPRPAMAWVVLMAGYAFWLLCANAMILLAHAYGHGAAHPDPAHGLTFALNNHGQVRWIAATDWARYEAGFAIGGAGFAVCIALLLVRWRAQVAAMIRKGAWAPPVLGLLLSVWAWAHVG